jgi:hypothetical protein
MSASSNPIAGVVRICLGTVIDRATSVLEAAA